MQDLEAERVRDKKDSVERVQRLSEESGSAHEAQRVCDKKDSDEHVQRMSLESGGGAHTRRPQVLKKEHALEVERSSEAQHADQEASRCEQQASRAELKKELAS
jgi:hypothetical protein